MSVNGAYTWGEVLVGSANKNDQQAAREFYEKNWVDTWGLAAKDSKTPDGAGQGFNLSALVEQSRSKFETVKEGDDDEFGVVRRTPSGGWGQYLEQRFGHRDIFKVAHGLQVGADHEENKAPQYEKVAKRFEQEDFKADKDVPMTLSATEEVIEKAAIDSGTVSSATPIRIDPDLFNTVRSAAPILDMVTEVAQAGFTASYNVISGRSDPIGMVSETDALDLGDNTAQDFTLSNADDDMKIYVDLVDVSDFAQRAETSLGFMDLQGTSLQQRTLEHAVFKAQQFYYGNPDQGASDGSVEDSNAYEGFREIAEGANASYVKDKSGTSLDADKALFKDLKSEVNALVKDNAVTHNDLRIMTSLDVFEALENEAQVNTRIQSFDGGVNFGGMTLSVAGVPVMPDPNIRDYSGLTGTTSDGDVFIIDERAAQFRALAPLSTMPLGRVGLGDRAALFEYGTLIDKSQGEHTRVLQNYQVPSLPTV